MSESGRGEDSSTLILTFSAICYSAAVMGANGGGAVNSDTVLPETLTVLLLCIFRAPRPWCWRA